MLLSFEFSHRCTRNTESNYVPMDGRKNGNLYFFDGNQESYCLLNMSFRVTRNTDSNYGPTEGRKNGSLRIRSRIWLGNIFPISRFQLSRNKILPNNTLVASYSRAVIA